MSDATREWIGLLRGLCIQHDIYAPAFPDMNLEELEHAATASRRFSSHLRSEFFQGGLVGPSSVRYLDPPPTGEEFEHIRLLPDGRFLLTSHKTTIKLLWDLGNHVSSLTHHAIASFEIPGAATIKSLRTRASHSSSEALVIISITDSEQFSRAYSQRLPTGVYPTVHPACACPRSPAIRRRRPRYSWYHQQACRYRKGIYYRAVGLYRRRLGQLATRPNRI
ncbi:hypothetical protein DFH08DRAFT_488320 [Mycena albidolilacea]|uniref:Uncharacterized protein n=1 Tax=Mycena albidolilacea TaxID=1033008 RepID=A0AAD7EAZ0_9AGAR|nr:hypothetical protein DFH08DRAFT_488320 [Mycena albidolilacea]